MSGLNLCELTTRLSVTGGQCDRCPDTFKVLMFVLEAAWRGDDQVVIRTGEFDLPLGFGFVLRHLGFVVHTSGDEMTVTGWDIPF